MFQAGRISWLSFSYTCYLFDRDSARLMDAFVAVYALDDSGGFRVVIISPVSSSS